MRKSMNLVIAAAALVVAFGCQQQSKPGKASSSKGLNRIHFDLDQAEVKSDYKKTLENNAKYLKENANTSVSVEGHCDERGSEEYNVALGHRRASTARKYLVSLGIASKRLDTKSFGEEKPMDSCHNESCWWKNRRAEFKKK